MPFLSLLQLDFKSVIISILIITTFREVQNTLNKKLIKYQESQRKQQNREIGKKGIANKPYSEIFQKSILDYVMKAFLTILHCDKKYLS